MPVLVSGSSSLGNGMVLRASSVAACPLFAIQTRQQPQFPQVGDVPANGFTITNNANTTIIHEGYGVFEIEKTSGASAYDASAISSVGITGDFVLRLRPLTFTNDSLWGVNSDPLTDNNFTGIDRAVDFQSVSIGQIYESGVSVGSTFAISTYVWIWRTGTALGYGTGATLAIAQVSPKRTVTDSSTLYFDSSVFSVGTRVEAYFYVPITYSLSADAGAYSLSGQTVGVAPARKLPASVGSYTLSGTSAALRVARRQIEAIGSYAITGTAAGLKKGFNLPASVGSYALTGIVTSLRVARRQVEAVGSYTISGTSTGLKAARKLAALAGAYLLSGTAVGLAAGRASVASPGAYALTGVPTAMRADRRLVASTGAYTMIGSGAGLAQGRKIAANSGTYDLTGTDVSLRSGRRLSLASGNYALLGTASTLAVGHYLAAQAGSYLLTGLAVDLRYGRPAATPDRRTTHAETRHPGSVAAAGQGSEAAPGSRITYAAARAA